MPSSLHQLFHSRLRDVQWLIKHFMTVGLDDVLQMVVHRGWRSWKREMIAICDPPPPASDWSIRRQNPVTGDRPQASTPYKRTDEKASRNIKEEKASRNIQVMNAFSRPSQIYRKSTLLTWWRRDWRNDNLPPFPIPAFDPFPSIPHVPT